MEATIVPSYKNYSREEALALAEKYNLQDEVKCELEHGCTPTEALYEWDLLDFDLV